MFQQETSSLIWTISSHSNVRSNVKTRIGKKKIYMVYLVTDMLVEKTRGFVTSKRYADFPFYLGYLEGVGRSTCYIRKKCKLVVSPAT